MPLCKQSIPCLTQVSSSTHKALPWPRTWGAISTPNKNRKCLATGDVCTRLQMCTGGLHSLNAVHTWSTRFMLHLLSLQTQVRVWLAMFSKQLIWFCIKILASHELTERRVPLSKSFPCLLFHAYYIAAQIQPNSSQQSKKMGYVNAFSQAVKIE